MLPAFFVFREVKKLPKDFLTFTIPSDLKLPKLDEEQVLQNIKKATLETVGKDTEVSLRKLKAEAKKFLASIKSLDENYAAFTQASLNKIITAQPDAVDYLNNIQIDKERLYTQSLFMLAFRFEEYLNRFRKEDQEREVLYVIEFTDPATNKKIVKSYPMSYKELVINSDKYGRINDISQKRLNINKRKSIEEQGIINKKHIEEARVAYEAVSNRIDNYFKKREKSGHLKQRQSGLLMWKENTQWMVGTVLNLGDLKEAYTSFLFEEHQKSARQMCKEASSPGVPKYYNDSMVKLFYNNYIQKVTNKPAILKEDVVTTDKQYGIKGRKAALPSLQQYIDTATYILRGEINAKNIEQTLEDYFDRNAVRNIQFQLGETYIEISDYTAKEIANMFSKIKVNKT